MPTLIAGIVLVVLGFADARSAVRIHYDGHRVLARVASVSHGRHPSTRLSFTTIAGVASECDRPGALGEVGTPMWIRYLSSDPSACGLDDLRSAMGRTFMLVGAGSFALIGAWMLRRRAQEGDDRRRPSA